MKVNNQNFHSNHVKCLTSTQLEIISYFKFDYSAFDLQNIAKIISLIVVIIL